MLLYQNESVAARRNIPFILVDSTDGFTQRSGILVVAGNIKVSKNGGTEVNHSGIITEVGGGSYYYQATSGELDTLGYLQARITPSGCRSFNALSQVININPYTNILNTNDIPNIVDQVWDETLTPNLHNTVSTAGRYLRLVNSLLSIDGTVLDTNPTNSRFGTSLTASNNFYNDQLLIFNNGNLIGQSKPITTYIQTSGLVTFDETFTTAPASGDSFTLYATHIHPVTQIGGSVWDVLRSAHTIAGSYGEGIIVVSSGITNQSFASGAFTPVYYADINYTVDTTNVRDEYTVGWFKNGCPLPSSAISSPTLQVIKRADGTDLIANSSMSFISTAVGTVKKDESTNRLGTGEAGIAVVQAIIDGATQTWRRLFSRDS